VFCQLEMLQNCLPQNVRRVLRDLPASLDETYERMLKEISKVNPDQVYRLLQCLAVSTRPLRVEELAEVLALDFDAAEEGIPALNKDWRWEDERQGVLATCSSLIVVVELDDWRGTTQVVQFAHFSVKEFLTSDRLADIKEDISRFHIRPEPAHTVIAQACLAILLRSDHNDSAKGSSPLSKYAARHWVDHSHFGNVSSRIEYGMRRLFDPAKPCFIAWLNSYNLDHEWTSFVRDYWDPPRSSWGPKPRFTSTGEDDAPLCLYYAALYGFRDVTEYLITKYPQHRNATVGHNKSPLAAALYNRHIQVAEILHQHGAVLPIGANGRTLLHAASKDGLVDIAQWLLIGADTNAQDDDQRTSLHEASDNGHVEIARLLIKHGADVHARDESQSTPLHRAHEAETARVLIKHGADVHARDQRQSTPLHLATEAETAQVLIKHGADVHARDQRQSTPLHLAHEAEIAQLLIKHGADVHARDESQSTPLHLAWKAEMAQVLIKHGADVHARDQRQSTPLHLAWEAETAQVLIKHGADVHARDQRQSTPLHLAHEAEIAQLLIKHGADVHARDESQSTPLHLAHEAEIAQVLIKHGADVHARDQRQSTPLHLAGGAEIAQLLIEHGADVHARDQSQSTPLHLAGGAEIAQLLIEHGADVHARDQRQSTPLHRASSQFPSFDETPVHLLIEHGASVNAYDKNHQTPLHRVSSCDDPDVGSLCLLLENGADVDVEDDEGLTAYQIASANGHDEIAQLLLDHRARIVSNTID
jgi:ankyrin repeat protein